MPFNINTFRTRGLTGGGARACLFLVRFPVIPPGVLDATADLEFFVQAASLPPAIVDSVDQYYFGRKVKYAGERIFPDWDINVINDENFKPRDMFESWSNKINTLVSNRYDLSNTMNSYKVDRVEVKQYSKAGPGDENGVIKSYTFWGVWPKVVSPIQLDWSRNNQIESFDVTLSYDYWEPDQFGEAGTYNPDIDSTSAYPGLVSQIVP